MSGLILFIVALALLGVAIYSLVSYLKQQRASKLPVHKKKK
ncbi:small membrane protein [Klebsiella quasipneumoniae]|nr:small membrane protein [Klebsiella quasipneumoniae]MCS6747711.1 small membrane protein [Klebsiella quasipneumoniae]MRE38308.1 small membrane protein [Klebsiella quasipneumoniae]MRF92553.1 small membrane protein [Klebsiella quasipneumoniae]HCI6435011.1 small membrane protein [Klebsiella quasipneumoniae subsp. similipneumoniae]